MSTTGPEGAVIDLDDSPFGLVPVTVLPFDRAEARAVKEAIAFYDAARGKVGPGELAYTDDSPFGIPPRD